MVTDELRIALKNRREAFSIILVAGRKKMNLCPWLKIIRGGHGRRHDNNTIVAVSSHSHLCSCVTYYVFVFVLCLVAQSSMDCSPPGSFVHGDSPGKNTEVGCHVLFQGIFPTQGWNPGIKPRSPALQADSSPSEPPGKPDACAYANVFISFKWLLPLFKRRNNLSFVLGTIVYTWYS